MSEEMSQKAVMEAVAVLGTEIKSASAESKAAVEKVSAFLDAQEKKSQELVQKLALEEKARLDLQDKIGELEKAAARPALAMDEKSRKAEELKAVHTFARDGVLDLSKLSAETKAYFRTDSDVNGGYLVEGEMDRSITRNLVELSPIRAYAMVQTIRSNRLAIPREDTTVTGAWVGEGKPVTAQATKFKKDEIRLQKMRATAEFTSESIDDAFVDFEAYVQTLVTEQFAALEGAAFVSGDGVLKPEGFVDTTLITARNSGLAADITFDNMIELTGDLKIGYNPAFFFNRATRVQLQLMKSGTNYLWQAGDVAKGVPNTVQGYNYVICQDMADIAANAVPVAFADLRRGYKIVDKAGTTVIRDIFTLADDGKIKLHFQRRTGGGIYQPEAIKLLKCAL